MYILHLLHYGLMCVIDVVHEICHRDMNVVCRYLWLIFIVHAYKRCTCAHAWTCRYPDFKVLTLLCPCGCFGRSNLHVY